MHTLLHLHGLLTPVELPLDAARNATLVRVSPGSLRVTNRTFGMPLSGHDERRQHHRQPENEEKSPSHAVLRFESFPGRLNAGYRVICGRTPSDRGHRDDFSCGTMLSYGPTSSAWRLR